MVGCGPVGLMSVIAARELGAKTVFAIDSVPERLALAQAYGARPIDRSVEDPLALIKEATEGRGADGVMEAVGNSPALRLAFDLLRPGGVLSSVGVNTADSLPFSPADAYNKNITFRSGRCPARHYMDQCLRILRRKRYDLSKIVSHRLPVEQGPLGYIKFHKKLENCTKVIIDFNGSAPSPPAQS